MKRRRKSIMHDRDPSPSLTVPPNAERRPSSDRTLQFTHKTQAAQGRARGRTGVCGACEAIDREDGDGGRCLGGAGAIVVVGYCCRCDS